MARGANDLNSVVSALVPTLSRSLAEEFNVFRVMHHGTHEKQLSNVFAWLLTTDGTHELGEAFQRIFLERVNAGFSPQGALPADGYRVVQEVNTYGGDGTDDEFSMDIADILLVQQEAAVIVENYGTSDGHGHDYHRYLAHATAEGRRSAVVLLCHRREAHLLRDGWEQSVVVTYGEVLEDLRDHVAQDPSWRRRHPEQNFFIEQMIDHFVEGQSAVNLEDQISFIRTMCETGESARYGYRPRDRATQEFAVLVAEHAKRQLQDSRKTLTAVKTALRNYSRTTLADQVNDLTERGRIEKVVTRFVGQWEWCVELQRGEGRRTIFVVFGPTAVVEIDRATEMVPAPDYTCAFVTHAASDGQGIGRIVQTDVGLVEIIAGLSPDDVRLRDAVLEVMDFA
ncbi:PD-(D/E)XK nuclease family protein [Brachybacterium sp. 107]|uniref:PD-(D/E)XK nuclease family protein n=1 Tax=Brachybacterium sp. 107 TaxID=3457736 RepID=UPI004033DABF